MVVMSMESYFDPKDLPVATPFEEKMMEESNQKAEESDVRLTHKEVFRIVQSRSISFLSSSEHDNLIA